MDASIIGRTYPPPPSYDVTGEAVRDFVTSVGAAYAGPDEPAPPTFAIVAAFPAMMAFLDAEGLDLSRIVHGEQRFSHTRPVRVGDRLSVSLTIASLRQIGGNDIIGTRSEITDAAGDPVCTGTATLVHQGGVMDLEIEPRTFRVTREDLVAYAAASGDHNPVHQDEEVARSVGLPGVIAHGMFTLALVARYLREAGVATEDVAELGGKFVKPVVVPDEGAEIEMRATRQDAEESSTTLTVEVLCAGERVFGPRGVRVGLRG